MNSKLNKTKSVLVICFLVSQVCFCQVKAPAPAVPSTNSMNLGLFGEVPVSMYSGLPDISIPIYTIQAKNISVPVSLSYHASGVKPEVHPSWVGSGWSLIAGGSIQRIMKRFPDECHNTSYSGAANGYYYSHAANTRSDWPDICQTSSCNTSFENWLKDYGDITRALTDYSPDEFMFSFPGHTGKFFLDDAGNWQVQCDKPVKVIFSGEFLTPFTVGFLGNYSIYAPRPFKKFTIIDEFGNQFVFGEVESAIEYSDVITQPDGALNGESFYATSWQLKRIISADGVDVIEFNYERGPFQSYLYNTFSGKRVYTWSYGGFQENPGCFVWEKSFHQGGKITSPVYLKSITYQRQDLKIDLSTSATTELKYAQLDYDHVLEDIWGPNNNEDYRFSSILNYYLGIPYFATHQLPSLRVDRFIWLKLDQINIINTRLNSTIKSVVLNFTNSTSERLKLLSVDFKDAANTGIQTYSFTYNTTQTIPNYLQTRGDHWGFNNGSPPLANVSDATLATYYSSREPNITYVKAGILEQMTYPTGGRTVFEYQMHDYSKVLTTSTTGVAGGLRVSKITKIDNAGHQEVTDYYYVTGYTAGANPATLTSSGVLDVIPQYDFSNFSGIDNFNHPFVEGLLSSNPVIPLSLTTSGRYIGYSEVVEKRSDGAYTIYKFTNHDNGYADVPAVKTYNRTYVPYTPNSSRDFERGKTLGKFVYDNTGKSIQSEEYEYDRLGTSGARNVQQDYGNLCSETESRIYTSRSAYYLYYYPFVVKKITSKNYQTGTGTSYTTTMQDFTYENKLVKTTITTNSKGQQLKAENFYPWNFSDPPIYPEMVARNMLDYVVQTDQSKASQLKKRTKIDYGMWPQWPNGGIYPYAVKEQIENNPLVTLVQVNDFDAVGNILSQTPKSGVKECFLWSYNQVYLVGKVVKADVADIAYTSFEINDNSAWNIPKVPSADYNAPTGRKVFSLSMGTISKSDLDPAKTYIVSYWSKNGTQDVNGTTGTAGRTVSGYTYYEHKIINPVNGLISVSGTGTIDELRLYPQGALMSTYTYEPLIGMSSQCDANNRITYYEYDAFGRMMLIRDQERNILKKICYNYDGHTENCAINYYYNTLQSAIFTPTCPPGYTGTSNTPVTYTVPANVYSSTISVDAANQMALAEIATYGQVYANTFTVCHQNVTVQFEFDLVSWYDDGYTYIENWDCWLRFYDPSNLWETIEIFEPLNIHYTITSTYGGTEHFYITAPANTREYYLGYFSEAIYSDPYWYNALQFNVVSWSW